MDCPPENEAAKSLNPLASFYSDYLWNRMRSLFPAASSSNFLSGITNFYRARKRRRRKTCLPLPLRSTSPLPESSVVVSEASRNFDVLEDIMEHIFLSLHYIQKNLEFWQSKAEGSNAQKTYFMVCERGPYAFINGTVQLIRDCVGDGSGVQHTYCMASSYISERIIVLSSLRYHIATFLAQVYTEVNKAGDELVKNPEKSLSSLLVAINELFLKLEASIGHFHAMRQKSSSVDESYSFPLILEKLPVINQDGSRWTDCEIKDAINLIYQNLDKLDSYLSAIVTIHRKPRKATLYWMRYTCGIVGISVCSLWLLRHSSLVGSSDIDNWICEAKESTVSFWNGHVEQPLLSIRDDLFHTFRKRQKGAMEPEEVQLTADSLHRQGRLHTIGGLKPSFNERP